MIQTDKVTYKMAYTQVLEILKRLPKEEVGKNSYRRNRIFERKL